MTIALNFRLSRRSNIHCFGLTFLLAVLAFSFGLPSHALADDALKDLSKNLIELRGKVQELNDQLEEEITNHRNRMQSLERQRGDIEVQIKRDQGQLAKLQNALSRNIAESKQSDNGGVPLSEVAWDVIKQSRQRINGGLPFKLEERLAELHEIGGLLEKELIPPHQAINRLWAFTEDELRLARENGLYRQPISLHGEKNLAEVARIGMTMLFFETSDGRYGAAKRNGVEWRFEEYVERNDREEVAHLFDSLRKQIRTGYFTLPNAFSNEVAQ